MKRKLFDRKNTLMLHGIAITMMIYHHLFVAGNNWCISSGSSLFDCLDILNFSRADTMQMTVAWFCKICVLVFAFTSGYVIYVQLDQKTDHSVGEMARYCIRRLFGFYKQYLICFLFFTGYEIITGNHSGYDFSVLNYVVNMLGFRISYNFTWWYVSVYYCMVFISPFVFSYLKGRIKNVYVILAACLFLFMVAAYFGYAYYINDFDHYLTIARNIGLSSWTIYPVIFIEGMVCARYDVMEDLLGRISVLESLSLLLAVFVLRTLFTRTAGDFIFDIVFVIPFVIGLSGTLGRCRYVKEFYVFIGKYSSYMWFVHAYFYAYLFFNLVMRSDVSALVYLQVCIYSLLAAMVFSFVMNDRDILFRRYRDFLDRTIQK